MIGKVLRRHNFKDDSFHVGEERPGLGNKIAQHALAAVCTFALFGVVCYALKHYADPWLAHKFNEFFPHAEHLDFPKHPVPKVIGKDFKP